MTDRESLQSVNKVSIPTQYLGSKIFVTSHGGIERLDRRKTMKIEIFQDKYPNTKARCFGVKVNDIVILECMNESMMNDLTIKELIELYNESQEE